MNVQVLCLIHRFEELKLQAILIFHSLYSIFIAIRKSTVCVMILRTGLTLPIKRI